MLIRCLNHIEFTTLPPSERKKLIKFISKTDFDYIIDISNKAKRRKHDLRAILELLRGKLSKFDKVNRLLILKGLRVIFLIYKVRLDELDNSLALMLMELVDIDKIKIKLR